jgi:hypothetical protein
MPSKREIDKFFTIYLRLSAYYVNLEAIYMQLKAGRLPGTAGITGGFYL